MSRFNIRLASDPRWDCDVIARFARSPTVSALGIALSSTVGLRHAELIVLEQHADGILGIALSSTVGLRRIHLPCALLLTPFGIALSSTAILRLGVLLRLLLGAPGGQRR